jgi:hypothetical protein
MLHIHVPYMTCCTSMFHTWYVAHPHSIQDLLDIHVPYRYIQSSIDSNVGRSQARCSNDLRRTAGRTWLRVAEDPARWQEIGEAYVQQWTVWWWWCSIQDMLHIHIPHRTCCASLFFTGHVGTASKFRLDEIAAACHCYVIICVSISMSWGSLK